MNLYEVTYRRYSSSESATYAIVARTPAKAIERALVIYRKQNYGSAPHEIVSVVKLRAIDGVQK